MKRRERHFKCFGPLLGERVPGLKSGEDVEALRLCDRFIRGVVYWNTTSNIDTLIDYLKPVMDDIITGQKNVVIKELRSENPQMKNKMNCLCAFGRVSGRPGG